MSSPSPTEGLRMAQKAEANYKIHHQINPSYGFLSSQAPDSTAFAANRVEGQFGIGAQTYDELCDYPPHVNARRREVTTKTQANTGKKATTKRRHQPELQPPRGRENVNPSKRVKMEETAPLLPVLPYAPASMPTLSSTLLSPSVPRALRTKWEISIQSQLQQLREKIESLEEENRRYRAQAEGRLDSKIQVKFYPLVQRMGELEDSMNDVNEKIRPFFADTLDDEEEELLVGISQPVEI